MLIRAPETEGELVCCVKMEESNARPSSSGAGDGVSPGLVILGKRYEHSDSGLEILCTRAGIGPITFEGIPVETKEPKALPSSD
jgi:hypothetical protein